MSGLAAGRMVSILVDGMPNSVLLFYLLAELAFALLAFLMLQKNEDES